MLTGRRLGAYEVQGLLGAGGMGEVYRARDTRLGRDVAIKILPPAFTSDPVRLARFEREARMLASLNHPHIGAIYGLEDSDGVRALVLELVEGETLAEKLTHGASRGLPITEALGLARQIADALDAAHERGIVHRDLKPANIKITPDGVVKVLDFGLAKVAAGDASAADTESAAVTMEGTIEGAVVGTVAYMSPEQARGKPVDKRTDIWAFGCVLYEMLTGRRAFPGETMSDTIAAILEREPDWSVLPSSAPPALVSVLRRCLAKAARDRSRDIGDVRLQIEDIDITTASVTSPAAIARRPRIAAWRVAVIALVVAGAAVGLLSLRRLGSPAPSGLANVRTELTQVTADEGLSVDPGISSDGSLLAYASDRAGLNNLDIWVQQSSGGMPVQVTHSAFDEREPAFSPDGRSIVFRSEADGGGIYIVPALGGQEPRLLAKDGRRPRFSPDGSSVAYWSGSSIGFIGNPHAYRSYTVPTGGGTPHEAGAAMTGARYPVWSADGRSLLVLGSLDARPTAATYDWWIVPLDEGAPASTGAYETMRQAGISTAGGNIGPDAWEAGRVLFSNFKSVWSLELDPASRRSGDVKRLTFGTTSDGQATISRSGTIAFASVTASDHIWSLPLDVARGVVKGPPQRLTSGTAIPTRDPRCQAMGGFCPTTAAFRGRGRS